MKKVLSLKDHARAGIRPGLERIRALLRELGNPQRRLKVVHVAGTNGKGSVCSLVEACLRESGWQTGLFTSPHLFEPRERIQIGGHALSRASFNSGLKKVLAAARRVEKKCGETVTYFEVLTALAFERFEKTAVDIAVLETGLGGRLDSTNVITRPLLTLITNIDLEHTDWLGTTLQAIAGEKAGIIKPGADLVTAARGKALVVIQKHFLKIQAARPARQRGKMLVLQKGKNFKVRQVRTILKARAGQEVDLILNSERRLFFLPLLGSHQHQNLACAMAALDKLEGLGYTCPEAARVAAVARVRWPGRLQLAGESPRLLLDGAHNPAGARALARALETLKRGRIALVVGVLRDKDWRGILKPLIPLASRVFVARPADGRGLEPGEALASLGPAQRRRSKHFSSVSKAFQAGRAWAKAADTVVVAGSLYTVAEVLRHLKNTSKC